MCYIKIKIVSKNFKTNNGLFVTYGTQMLANCTDEKFLKNIYVNHEIHLKPFAVEKIFPSIQLNETSSSLDINTFFNRIISNQSNNNIENNNNNNQTLYDNIYNCNEHLIFLYGLWIKNLLYHLNVEETKVNEQQLQQLNHMKQQIDTQSKQIHTQSKQIMEQSKQIMEQNKQILEQNKYMKELESHNEKPGNIYEIIKECQKVNKFHN